ncbi:M23 family metallopeptidase [Candidatus Bathyarchaeota archaeon]|nr:M23 family metallopeptidase [Candidatus Bathyarchaeota archaeon]
MDIAADKKFRHMCTSAAEVRQISKGYDVVARDKPQKFDVGLMEGYLTLPFSSRTVETRHRSYVDVDMRRGVVKDWMGIQASFQTYDNHLGTDFFLRQNTEILSAASGKVVESKYDNDDGHRITIQHFDQRLTIYCHLNSRKVEEGTKLKRGDMIGLSGNTGKLTGPYAHLHFQFGGFGKSRIDPYRDITDPSSLSWWTKDNDPQYPD